MLFHYQNLNERRKYSGKKTGPLWRHGRAWLHLKRGEVRAEWVLLFTRSCRIGFEAGTGDSPGWQLSLAVPFLFSIWLTVCLPWLPVPRGKEREFEGHKLRLIEGRRFSLYVFEWSIRLALWERENEWRRDDPWWVRSISWDLRNILGKQHCTRETLKAPFPVTIPLPEGAYTAQVKLIRMTWRRRFGRTITRLSWDASMEAPACLPTPGKWSRGDGLCGWGAESRNGEDIEKVIAEGVRSVLEERRRRASIDWMPSPKAAVA